MDKNAMRNAVLQNPAEVMPPFDTILEIAGFDALYDFVHEFNGQSLYVPNPRTIFVRCLEMEVKKEFTGQNFSGLAKKYGYTERHKRRVIQGF